MEALFLSYFDELLGPATFQVFPLGDDPAVTGFSSRIRRKVGKLAVNQGEEGFFIRDFDTFTTANYRFSVRSEWTHSARQFLNLTIATDTYPAEVFRGPLEKGAARLQKMTNVASAFYVKSRPGDESVQQASVSLKEFVVQLGNDIRDIIEQTRAFQI